MLKIKFKNQQNNEIQINWNFKNLIPNVGDTILINDENQHNIKVNKIQWDTINNEVLIYTSFNENYGKYNSIL